MRAVLTAAFTGLLLLAPTAHASSLEDELEDVRFEQFVFTFTWNTETDRANVNVDAKDLILQGEAASELRHCIDRDECVVPALSQAARESTKDGDVTEGEVESFAFYVLAGMMSLPEMKKIHEDIKRMIKIDNLAPTSLQFSGLTIRDAEGDVDSQDEIRITVNIVGSFATVPPAETHDVWVQRREANFTVADEIIVQAGKGWRINEDSIKPESAAGLFTKGKFRGSQEEFESTEPLEFTLEKSKKTSSWGLVGSLAAVGVAALLTAIFVMRRRKL